MTVHIVMHTSTSTGGGSIHDCSEIFGVYANEKDALDRIRDEYKDCGFSDELESSSIFEEGIRDIREAKASDVWLSEERTWIVQKEITR